MHERGLDQPLEVLVACDGIEAGDKLTGPWHCKLLGKKEKQFKRRRVYIIKYSR